MADKPVPEKVLIPLAQDARSLPVPITRKAVGEWVTRGVAGRRLPAVRIGRRWFVEVGACRRFALGDGSEQSP